MGVKYNGFQSLLYYKFIIEKLYRVDETAKKMGVPVSTLYHWIEGETTFPPDMIAPLYNATGDSEFIDYFLRETNLRAVPRNGTEKSAGLLEEALDVGVAVGHLSEEIKQALHDGYVCEREKERIERAIESLYTQIEELRLCVKSGRKELAKG